MPTNDLAPGFIKLFYTSNGNQHIDTIPILFDGVPTIGLEPLLLNASGTSVTTTVGLTAYITAIKIMLHTTSSYTGFEVYSKAVGGEPIFIWGNDLSIAGTSATATVVDSQAVISFRSSQGGVAKIYIMEHTQAVNQRVAARTGAAAPVGTLVTFLLGTTNIRISRDGGRLISGIYYTTKTNDALRKKRLLDN